MIPVLISFSGGESSWVSTRGRRKLAVRGASLGDRMYVKFRNGDHAHMQVHRNVNADAMLDVPEWASFVKVRHLTDRKRCNVSVDLI